MKRQRAEKRVKIPFKELRKHGPIPLGGEPQPVIVTGNTLIFNYRVGDTHNETHFGSPPSLISHESQPTRSRGLGRPHRPPGIRYDYAKGERTWTTPN